MEYDIHLKTRTSRDALAAEIANATASGPFTVLSLEASGVDTWRVQIAPRRAEICVNFAKVAEFQLLLSHFAEVISLARTDLGDLAVAS